MRASRTITENGRLGAQRVSPAPRQRRAPSSRILDARARVFWMLNSSRMLDGKWSAERAIAR